MEKIHFEYPDFNKKAGSHIKPSEIYGYAVKVMRPEEIDHHGNGHGLDDLYLKVTPQSRELILRLSTNGLVSKFQSPIDGAFWYELPFCYPGKN